MNTDAIRYDRIKALREEHGYTLRYVAGKIGVTESTAQRHENGRGIKDIPYTAIVGYAKLYHVNPAYLMGWTDEEARANPEAFLDRIGEEYKEGLTEEDIWRVWTNVIGGRG